MDKEQKTTIIVIIFLLIVIAIFGFWKPFAITGKLQPVGMIQYDGGFDRDYEPWAFNRKYPLVTSSIAIFGEYKIVTEKADFKYEPIYSGNEPIYKCEENICGGVPDHIDADGCQIWKKSNVLSSCTAKSGTPTCMPSACNACCFKSSSTPLDVTHCKGEGGCLTCGCIVQYCNKNYVDKECGGLKPSNIISYCCDYTTCWGKFKIYKNNVLLKETQWAKSGILKQNLDITDVTQKVKVNLQSRQNSGEIFMPPLSDLAKNICYTSYVLSEYTHQDYSTGNIQQTISLINDGNVEYFCVNPEYEYLLDNPDLLPYFKDSGMTADFMFNSAVRYSSCKRIENSFSYRIPEYAFEIDSIFKENEIVINITNRFRALKGNMSLKYVLDYVLYDQTFQTSQTFSKIVDIPSGGSLIRFPISKQAGKKVLLTPYFDVIMEGSEFSGVNGICYGQTDNEVQDLSQCEYVQFGSFKGETKEIYPYGDCKIEGCPEGIICGESGYCERVIDCRTIGCEQGKCVESNGNYICVVEKNVFLDFIKNMLGWFGGGGG